MKTTLKSKIMPSEFGLWGFSRNILIQTLIKPEIWSVIGEAICIEPSPHIQFNLNPSYIGLFPNKVNLTN